MNRWFKSKKVMLAAASVAVLASLLLFAVCTTDDPPPQVSAPECTPNSNCPNDIINCKVGETCTQGVSREDCGGQVVSSCQTTTPPGGDDCTPNSDCPNDIVNCKVGETCTQGVSREDCGGQVVSSCPTTTPPGGDDCTPNSDCPNDIINCKLGDVCTPGVPRKDCANGMDVPSCETTPPGGDDCTKGVNCPDDLVDCDIDGFCLTGATRAECEEFGTVRPNACSSTGPTTADYCDFGPVTPGGAGGCRKVEDKATCLATGWYLFEGTTTGTCSGGTQQNGGGLPPNIGKYYYNGTSCVFINSANYETAPTTGLYDNDAACRSENIQQGTGKYCCWLATATDEAKCVGIGGQHDDITSESHCTTQSGTVQDNNTPPTAQYGYCDWGPTTATGGGCWAITTEADVAKCKNKHTEPTCNGCPNGGCGGGN